MDQLLEFIGNHYILTGTFVLLLVLFIRNETQRGGRGVTAQQLVDMVNREKAVVVDVRDKKEFDAGHIVDAINIPFSALDTRLDELKKFRERPIVVTCKMGQHAGAAGKILHGAGFKQIKRLSGGIGTWKADGMPLVKGK